MDFSSVIRVRSATISWNFWDEATSHALWYRVINLSVEFWSMASAIACNASPHSEFRSKLSSCSMRLQVRARAMALAPSTLDMWPRELLDTSSADSWQSCSSKIAKCLAPSDLNSLHLRSNLRKVLFSMRKDTSCRTPSSRILIFPRLNSVRFALTRNIRPKWTVCSSCNVWMRGFSMLQTCSCMSVPSSASATPITASMSASQSCSRSCKRFGELRRKLTTHMPPSRPRGLNAKSSSRSSGHALRASHTAAHPFGPIEFDLNDNDVSRVALLSNVLASVCAPASVSKLHDKSRRDKQLATACKAAPSTGMSSSSSRELKASLCEPGASMSKVSFPASTDACSDIVTR
mmetsp:Transcript_3838/g.11527  ORF Transcript_3838/g.11527 Transcript_3838/m.11527 type:complete len:348 (-) Transcript_3838:189-1232(-)